jgi:sialidase-1
MPDKAVQLSTGRIILPIESPWPTEGRNYTSLVFYSDNEGYSWWPSSNVVDLGSTTEEPSVVELADGRLAMFCRNNRGYMARACSEDQGETWSEPELVEDLPHPNAGFHVVTLPTTGDLLAVFCQNLHAPALARGEEQPTVQVAQLRRLLGQVRAPLTTAISRDGGLTWEHHRDITHDPEGVYGDYGYPGVAFVEDGTVCLVNYHAIDGLHLARIGVDWLYGR